MKPSASPWSLLITATLIVFLSLSSCNKDPYLVGYDILPPNDTIGISVTDTVTVWAYTILHDSTRSDETPTNILGSIVDPVFGKTTASFHAQFLMSSEAVEFGDNAQVDSLVLVLYYTGYSGDTNTTQRVKVYELSQELFLDSSYYSNQVPGNYGLELADVTFKPRPTDSVKHWTTMEAAQLRINLTNKTNYLGNKIINAPASILASNKEFVKFFRGLSIQSMPVDSKGALLEFTTNSSISKLVLYFRNETTGQGDSLRYNFVMNSSSAHYNTFDHNGYADASPEFQQQVVGKDTTLGREKLYVQPGGGTRIKLLMPYLKMFGTQGKVAINNAQLVMTSLDNDTTFGPIPELGLVLLDSAGKVGKVQDAADGASYFGGNYIEEEKAYKFRLTQHIQNLIDKDTVENPYLYIYAADPANRVLTTKRAILNGTNPLSSGSSPTRFQLKVTYTRLQ